MSQAMVSILALLVWSIDVCAQDSDGFYGQDLYPLFPDDPDLRITISRDFWAVGTNPHLGRYTTDTWLRKYLTPSGYHHAMKQLSEERPRVQLADLSPDLPEFSPNIAEYKASDHIILYDHSIDSIQGYDLRPKWAKQADFLAAKIKELGVAPEQIHISRVERMMDFSRSFAGKTRPIRVYIFAHGAPMGLIFGREAKILDGRMLAMLNRSEVRTITHYGCSFVRRWPSLIRYAESQMEEGTTLTLYGHRWVSTPYDDQRDNLWNPIEPLVLRSTMGLELPR